MRISCIIPTRNRCQMVLKAIGSVKEQDYSGLEIIVVDDSSTDNTLAEISSRFPEVHIVKLQHHSGPGLARNAGAAASSSDVFMFLDSDDIWLGNHAERLVNVLSRGFEVAYGTAKTIDEINDTDFLIPENGFGPEGKCFDALIRWCFLVPSAMAVTRRAFVRTGGFAAVPYGEDWLFFLKLASLYPFGFTGQDPITLRKLHPDSLCFLSDAQKPLAIINQVLTFLEKEPRATAAHCNRFRMLYNWTAENFSQWSTMQDWYLSLLKEKLI